MGTEYALERIIRPYPYIWLDWLQKYSTDISAWIAEGATNREVNVIQLRKPVPLTCKCIIG